MIPSTQKIVQVMFALDKEPQSARDLSLILRERLARAPDALYDQHVAESEWIIERVAGLFNFPDGK